MSTEKFGKIKQQRRALLVALYVLRHFRRVAKPRRQDVLRYIQSNGLLLIPPEDQEDCKAGCMIWEEELSYHRLALKNEGFMRMPAWGIWELTESGERDVEAWAERVKKTTDRKPNWEADFKTRSNSEGEFEDSFHYDFYITEETVRWGIKIAELPRNGAGVTAGANSR